MRLRSTALVLLAAIAVLVACHGTSNYVPQNGAISSDSDSAAVGNHLGLPASTPNYCNVPFSHVPGNYVEMTGIGNLKGSTFTGTGEWFVFKYSLGTPPPHATPTPGVTPTPNKKEPLYYYYGNYTLKKEKQTGCAILLTTQNGKPLKGIKGKKFNALNVEDVLVSIPKHKSLRLGLPTMAGTALISISGISATSGTGSADLHTNKGKAYDTAAIKILGRLAIP